MEELHVTNPEAAADVVAKLNAKTVEGTVKTFDINRGFGFITQDGANKEVFVHQEAIMARAIVSLPVTACHSK